MFTEAGSEISEPAFFQASRFSFYLTKTMDLWIFLSLIYG
jgi:hypothetical protein